jgi:hypothetical protein
MSLKTDPANVFTSKSLISLAGYDMTALAAKDVFIRNFNIFLDYFIFSLIFLGL